MAGIPKVKITFDADFDELKKGIKSGQRDVETFSSRVADFGKKAAAAFAVAGAAIGAFALASVKAAAEDETAQKKLEETLRNTTNATTEQIKSIDKYVTAQSIATATTDNEIRPALSRLLRATGDLNKSQELLTLSQEISIATGKPLEAVTNAVSKSFEGSNTALGKLGIGIDAATLKTLTFDETQQLLNSTFDGFIENQATTTAFKFDQISIAVSEAKESIGAALLPMVQRLADFLIKTAVPNLNSFIQALTGKGSIAEATENGTLGAFNFGKMVEKVIKTVYNFRGVLIATAAVIGGVFVVSKTAAAVAATIIVIQSLIKAYNALKTSALVAGIASAFALNPLLGVGAVALAAGVLAAANALGKNENNAVNELGVPANLKTDYPDFVAPPPLVIEPFKGGSFMGTNPRGTTNPDEVMGAGSQEELTKRLEQISETIKEMDFRFATGGISRNAQLEQLEPLLAEMQVLTKQQQAINAQPKIDITVNGAIDPEGTSRTIVKTLNNSFYRGTSGAGALVFE